MAGIHSIAPEQCFTDALIPLLEAHSPLSEWPQLTLLLPTQRSIRAMRDAFDDFRKQRGMAAMPLPKMKPIGEVDEAQLIIDMAQDESFMERYRSIPKAISKQAAHYVLAGMIRGENEKQAYQGFDDPSFDFVEALSLAKDMVALYSRCHQYNVPLEKLNHVFTEFAAEHWQIRGRLLQRVTKGWLHYCHTHQCALPEARRAQLLMLQAELWQNAPAIHRIVAAGSTGSIPATSTLLSVIAQLPNGMVVLPGYRKDEAEPSNHIFERLKDTVEDRWGKLRYEPVEAKQAMPVLVECSDMREEVIATTLLIREAVETHTICVVTNDNTLSQDVRLELERFAIQVDNPDGVPLHHTSAGRLVTLLSHMVARQGRDLTAFLSLLHHPLCPFGATHDEVVALARLLEVNIARRRGFKRHDALSLLHQSRRVEEAEPHYELIEVLIEVCEHITSHRGEYTLSQHHAFLCQMLEKVTNGVEFYAAHEGATLREQLNSLFETVIGKHKEHYHAYHALLVQWLSQATIRDSKTADPRVMILSPQEARLQRFDRLIIAEMNEGSWPLEERSGESWLSPMAMRWIGLPERVAQDHAAHDLVTLMGVAQECFFVRAKKKEGREMSPSAVWQQWHNDVDHPLVGELLQRARTYDVSSEEYTPLNAPRPSLSGSFPERVSVTDMELLRRDPYGFYAKKILGLAPLEEIQPLPGSAEFGQLLHGLFEHLTLQENEGHSVVIDEASIETLCAKLGYRRRDMGLVDPLWWPRIMSIVTWFHEQDMHRRQQSYQIIPETTHERALLHDGIEMMIHGRIDRLEKANDHYVIADYKTGVLPTKKEMELGYALQLPLLRWLVAEPERDQPIELHYWHCKGGNEPGGVQDRTAGEATQIEHVVIALNEMMEKYLKEDTPFLACPIEQYAPHFNRYEHLERQSEWRDWVA